MKLTTKTRNIVLTVLVAAKVAILGAFFGITGIPPLAIICIFVGAVTWRLLSKS